MPRYTLTISPSYVKDWKEEEAIREFLQNAIDQESLDSANYKSIVVDRDKLTISNAKSVLNKSTLLLGGGTKDGSNTIGMFGEGYKIGLLVLLREGFKVEIKNYGIGELWIPKLVNSRIYESTVLAIDTETYDFGSYVPNSLSIEISKEGSDFSQILDNIWLDFKNTSSDEDLSTNLGTILSNEEEAGNIYINGLLITHISKFRHGYNFKPNVIKVGRDRNVVAGYDLESQIGNIWCSDLIPNSMIPYIIEMIENKVVDAEYINEYRMPTRYKEAIAEKYKGKYVANTESDKAAIKETYGTVPVEIVPENIKTAVYSQLKYNDGIVIKQKGACELLQEFMEKYENSLNSDMLDDLEIILERI